MTLLLQPPDQTKDASSQKQAGESKAPPAKSETTGIPVKDAPAKTGQDTAPAKDSTPPVQQPPPEIPVQLPPGAKLGVPAKEPAKKMEIGSILQPALLLIAILAGGAILIAWLRKNRDRQSGAVALSANEQLTAFRESLEQGDMTDEEFKKVKAHLAEKIRKPANPVTAASGQVPQTGQAPASSDTAK